MFIISTNELIDEGRFLNLDTLYLDCVSSTRWEKSTFCKAITLPTNYKSSDQIVIFTIKIPFEQIDLSSCQPRIIFIR